MSIHPTHSVNPTGTSEPSASNNGPSVYQAPTTLGVPAQAQTVETNVTSTSKSAIKALAFTGGLVIGSVSLPIAALASFLNGIALHFGALAHIPGINIVKFVFGLNMIRYIAQRGAYAGAAGIKFGLSQDSDKLRKWAKSMSNWDREIFLNLEKDFKDANSRAVNTWAQAGKLVRAHTIQMLSEELAKMNNNPATRTEADEAKQQKMQNELDTLNPETRRPDLHSDA